MVSLVILAIRFGKNYLPGGDRMDEIGKGGV
jgi:hypothetical protein